MRENFRSVVSNCGKWQQRNSLLHQGISVNLLHVPAHDEISLANLFSSLSVLQPTHHLRSEGKWVAGKQTQTQSTFYELYKGVTAEGAVTVLWAASSVERRRKEREKGKRAMLREGTQPGRQKASLVICEWSLCLRSLGRTSQAITSKAAGVKIPPFV